MQTIEYNRGGYPWGHGIRCKHCGHSFEEHQKPETVRNQKVLRKRFRSTFSHCLHHGYEPANLNTWGRRERTRQRIERENFQMACWEKEAQSRAAWGQYAAHVGQQNYRRELTRLEERASHSGSEGQKGKEDLSEFLENKRKSGGMLYIG